MTEAKLVKLVCVGRVTREGSITDPGEEIEVTPEEAERLERLGAAAKPNSKAARRAKRLGTKVIAPADRVEEIDDDGEDDEPDPE